MELTSEPQVTFQDFPAEIFEKVFVYTLPDDALDKKQPNMRITPCSSATSVPSGGPLLFDYQGSGCAYTTSFAFHCT
jgi:hypothetical protein